MKTLKFQFSWDDGEMDDLKVAEILLKHKLPGIFYIPSFSPLTQNEVAELAQNFEIGGHTVSHPEDLKRLDQETLRYEIRANKYHLEDAIGRPVTKFCYPSGRYNERVIDELKLAGYEEARTTLVLKTAARDPFRTDTTIHVFPRREYENFDWSIIAKAYADKAAEEGGYFHIWGHSKDLDDWNYWEKLDQFLGWVKENYQIVK